MQERAMIMTHLRRLLAPALAAFFAVPAFAAGNDAALLLAPPVEPAALENTLIIDAPEEGTLIPVIEQTLGGGNSLSISLTPGSLSASTPLPFGSGLAVNTLRQLGSLHVADLSISGRDNAVAMLQEGTGHFLSASISGVGNALAVSQSGAGHRAVVTQTGTSNSLLIRQSSW